MKVWKQRTDVLVHPTLHLPSASLLSWCRSLCCPSFLELPNWLMIQTGLKPPIENTQDSFPYTHLTYTHFETQDPCFHPNILLSRPRKTCWELLLWCGQRTCGRGRILGTALCRPGVGFQWSQGIPCNSQYSDSVLWLYSIILWSFTIKLFLILL